MQTAILIDGGFFVRRFPKLYPTIDKTDAKSVVKELYGMCLRHLNPSTNHRANVKRTETEHNEETEYHKPNDLNRIFFYDCKPLTKRVHQPISGKALNLEKTPEAKFRLELHEELRCQRKVALRLGHLDEKNAKWVLKPNVLKDLLQRKRLWESLKDNDFKYYARQKVVDLKIGVDITLLAEKKLVDQIILISGDSDFVPASKHARREGLDIVLDPLWNPIAPELWEHIDGLRSTSPRPLQKHNENKARGARFGEARG